MSEVFRNCIAGQWVESKTKKPFANINPANIHEVVGLFQASGPDRRTFWQPAMRLRTRSQVGHRFLLHDEANIFSKLRRFWRVAWRRSVRR
jgi:hypothetical protein